MNIGEVVEYKGRQWYVNDIYGDGLCQIVVVRNGKHTSEKHFKSAGYEWTETYLNANITNLPIKEIERK